MGMAALNVKLSDLPYRYLAQTARETNNEDGLDALRVLLGKLNDSNSGLSAHDASKVEAHDAIEKRSKQLADQNSGGRAKQ
jgi:gamma-glutamyl:cysteine ligase YbdK (ATP-grasp superfamily)